MDTEQAEQGGKSVLRGWTRPRTGREPCSSTGRSCGEWEARGVEGGLSGGVREDTGESDVRKELGADRGGL